MDLTIVVVSLILLSMLLDFISGGVASGAGDQTIGNVVAAWEFLTILGIILGFFGWYGYFLIQELGPRGATFGKRAVGIRVAARKGGRLTPEAIIARNLLRDVEVFYPIVYLIV
ncbi:MAG: RDD family protein, partial [Pseudomonadota bacterium]